MSANLDTFEQIDLLVGELLDGTSSDATWTRLAELLEGNTSAQEHYLSVVAVHTELAWAHEQAPRVLDTPPTAEDSVLASAPSLPAYRERLFARILRHEFRVGIVAAMLLTVAAIVWSAVTYLPDFTRRADPPVNPEWVAHLDGRYSAEWLDGTSPAEHRPRLIPGQRLSIASGFLDIKYRTGARVVIEGPAEFYVGGKSGNAKAESGEGIQRSNSGFLKLGKLTARVETPEAQGFTIRTPMTTIEDLGTEFGVSVVKDGRTRVRVFEGRVRVHPNDKSLATASLMLSENEAASIERSTRDIVATDASQLKSEFVRAEKLEELEELEERISDDYEKLVLALKPTAYWRMEGKNKSQVTDSGAGGHHGVTKLGAGQDAPWASGKIGRAAWLRGPAFGDCVVVSDYPKTTTGQISVAAWVRADKPQQWGLIAADWTTGASGFHFATHAGGGDPSIYLAQSNGRYVIAREGASQPLPVGSWQHVAFVADGRMLRLYRNGREVVNIAYDGTIAMSPNNALGIGAKLLADGVPDLHWQGSIDEVVMFDRGLSAEEIRLLAQLSLSVDRPKERSPKRK